jgi:hypothetical protein
MLSIYITIEKDNFFLGFNFTPGDEIKKNELRFTYRFGPRKIISPPCVDFFSFVQLLKKLEAKGKKKKSGVEKFSLILGP